MKKFVEDELKNEVFDFYTMTTAFDLSENEVNVKMGIVTISPGHRIPAKGFNYHSSKECSYILEGSLVTGSENEDPVTVKAGEFITYGQSEGHWCINEGTEDCRLVWCFVKKEN